MTDETTTTPHVCPLPTTAEPDTFWDCPECGRSYKALRNLPTGVEWYPVDPYWVGQENDGA